jgi:hypothetical protein
MEPHRLIPSLLILVAGCVDHHERRPKFAQLEAGVGLEAGQGIDSGSVSLEAGLGTGIGSVPVAPCTGCARGAFGGAVALTDLDGGKLDAETVFPCGAAATILTNLNCQEATGYLVSCQGASSLGYLPASDPGCVVNNGATKDAVRKCGNILCP